jgi:hypothetical protein
MIRALSGVRSDDAYGCMVLLVLTDPQNSNPWCPNTRGAISTRVCDAHEQGLAGEGRLLTTADLGVSSS